jgi:hypothetical protein
LPYRVLIHQTKCRHTYHIVQDQSAGHNATSPLPGAFQSYHWGKAWLNYNLAIIIGKTLGQNDGGHWMVPELLFDSKGLIPMLQQLLTGG